MEHYLSAAEVAEFVDDYRTIENWAAQKHLARENGKYGLISALQYRITQLNQEIEEIKDNPKRSPELKS